MLKSDVVAKSLEEEARRSRPWTTHGCGVDIYSHSRGIRDGFYVIPQVERRRTEVAARIIIDIRAIASTV